MRVCWLGCWAGWSWLGRQLDLVLFLWYGVAWLEVNGDGLRKEAHGKHMRSRAVAKQLSSSSWRYYTSAAYTANKLQRVAQPHLTLLPPPPYSLRQFVSRRYTTAKMPPFLNNPLPSNMRSECSLPKHPR